MRKGGEESLYHMLTPALDHAHAALQHRGCAPLMAPARAGVATVVISKECSPAMAAAQPVAYQQRSYEVCENKHDMEGTTCEAAVPGVIANSSCAGLPHRKKEERLCQL